MIRSAFIIVCLFFSILIEGSADLIIFSYNRPLQLYALLESVHKYVSGFDQIMVIYRASDESFENAYSIVKTDFPATSFYCQHNAPHDFKSLVLDCLGKAANRYILFAVDDVVVKDRVDIDACVEQMQMHDVYGFFLRLGKNLNYSYATFSDQALPSFIVDQNGICVWNFAGADGDWGYPNSLDMTLYLKADLMKLLIELDYQSPNQLEHYLAMRADYSKKEPPLKYQKLLICRLIWCRPIPIITASIPLPSSNY